MQSQNIPGQLLNSCLRTHLWMPISLITADCNPTKPHNHTSVVCTAAGTHWPLEMTAASSSVRSTLRHHCLKTGFHGHPVGFPGNHHTCLFQWVYSFINSCFISADKEAHVSPPGSSLHVWHNLQQPKRNLMEKNWQLDGRRWCQSCVRQSKHFTRAKPVSTCKVRWVGSKLVFNRFPCERTKLALNHLKICLAQLCEHPEKQESD